MDEKILKTVKEQFEKSEYTRELVAQRKTQVTSLVFERAKLKGMIEIAELVGLDCTEYKKFL